MAVLTQIPEIDVSVHVNGQPAKEYPSPCQDDNHTLPIPDPLSHECYIESKSGQTYTIEVTIAPELKLPGKRDLCVRLFVDGKFIEGRVREHRDSSRSCHFSLIGPTTLSPKSKVHRTQKLTFSPVTTVEETSQAIIKRDARISADLGTIVVDVKTCTMIGKKPMPTRNYKHEEKFTLAEKSMKGRELSHGTRLTEGPVIQPPTGLIVSHEQVFAQYTFRYRSRSALQNEMILPQTPPPQHSSILDQLQAMTEDELRLLDKKLFQVKREKEIKPETNGTPRLKRTIDLTDDDVIEVSGHSRIKAGKLEGGCEVVDLT